MVEATSGVAAGLWGAGDEVVVDRPVEVVRVARRVEGSAAPTVVRVRREGSGVCAPCESTNREHFRRRRRSTTRTRKTRPW